MMSFVICRRLLQGALDLRRTSNLFLCLSKTSSSCCKPEKPKSDKTCGAGGAKGGGSGGAKTKHQITYKPYTAPCYKDHDQKNMGLKRPMSPHLTIYAPTMPAMTSITERITGIVLSFYVFMISCGTLFLSNGIDSYVSMIQSLDLSRPLLFIMKLILGFPFAYHYFFGIRFCVWNAGRWLSMKDVTASAKNMAIAAAAITFLFALF